MAEYQMTYEEIASIVEEAIEEAENHENLRAYQPIIMAAITGDYEMNNLEETTEMVDLWKNMIAEPSQFFLGGRYIRISEIMIEIIRKALTSGFVGTLIDVYTGENPLRSSVELAAKIASALWDAFRKASRLEGDEHCIYLQAMAHYHQHKAFTEDDLMDWFPHGENAACNIHNPALSLQCDRQQNGDFCGMDRQKIHAALESLVSKGILEPKKDDNNKYTFCFRR